MTAFNFDVFESKALSTEKIEAGLDKIKAFNSFFHSEVKPSGGIYGVAETLKDNGILERISRNEFGHIRKEYLQNDQLIRVREKINNTTWHEQHFDDHGTHYMTKTYEVQASSGLLMKGYSLTPGSNVVKGNLMAKIDNLGRPVYNKVTDLQLSERVDQLSSKLKDASYRPNDERGHIIADNFGGTPTKENIVPQDFNVNRTEMKAVEKRVRDLKNEGHKVDYEVKVNYTGKDMRPSSFEPQITVDGEKYTKLPEHLRKIYNENPDNKPSIAGKILRTAEENATKAAITVKPYHETGLRYGASAAAATFVKSTVENSALLYKGEISAEEMAVNIVKDTAAGGISGYGVGFVSSAVADQMKNSSHTLIRSVSKIKVPTEAVTFAVMSFDSIVDYAQGEIDGRELAYDLGDNAVAIAGSKIGMAVGTAGATAVAGMLTSGAGTAVATGVVAAGTAVAAPAVVTSVAITSVGILGAMVGTAVATEVYQTAMTTDFENIDQYVATVKDCAAQTIDAAKEFAPEHVEDIKASLNQFAANVNLPFSLT